MPSRFSSYILCDIVNVNIIRWTLLCDILLMHVGYMWNVTYSWPRGSKYINPVQGNLV